MFRLILLGLFVIFMLSCSDDTCINGNEDFKTFEYELQEFQDVENSFSGTVKLHNGSHRVAAYVESNIADKIDYKVADQSLIIGTKDECINPSEIHFDIYAENFRVLENNGSADWTSDYLEFDPKIISNGSGDIKLIGKSTTQEVLINGSGDIDLSNMETEKADIEVNGSGDAMLKVLNDATVLINGSGDIFIYNITGKLKVEINGSGNLHYSGNPSDKEFKVNGSGQVIKE